MRLAPELGENGMASFSDQLQAIANRRKAALSAAVRTSVLEMASEMARLSPVDTGRFRASWTVSLGTPAPAPAGLRFSAGSLAGLQIGASLSAWQPGETIYVTNSLPYARQLEMGSSRQAPAGMVRVTIADFRARFAANVAAALREG